MCGILGFLTDRSPSPSTRSVMAALSDIEHRGPDDYGFTTFDPASASLRNFSRETAPPPPSPVLLGATRLSILDLTAAAHQPFPSENGRHILAYNGEIYNYRELREELQSHGATFRSSGDTELLLKAFEAWGPDCLPRFKGMYAFAIFDTHARRLFLARDPFGIKPLYYTLEGGFFFASQPGALLALSGASRRIDPENLQRYLKTGWSDSAAGRTLIDSVKRFPAGAFATVDLSSPHDLRIEKFWTLPPGPASDMSFGEAAKHLRELVLNSVEMHLRSDVPIASALSGGVDSSSVVACARRILGSNTDIHTFTFAGSGVAETDEEPWARIVSDACATTMHRVAYAPEKLAENFERFVYLQDWPASSPVIFAQQQVFTAARAAGFKVMLSGQGPDEYLAGYAYYISARAASEIRRGRLDTAASLLLRAESRAPMSRLGLAKRTVGSILDAPLRKLGRRKGPRLDIPPGSNEFRAAVRYSLEQTPLPGVLRIEDANSMACSVESRLPLLTPDIVQFVLSLPDSFLVTQNGRTKAILKAAMRGITPDAILDRRDKMGFPVPLNSWLRKMSSFCEPWVQEAANLPCLNSDHVIQTWKTFLTSPEGPEFAGHGFMLWRWIFLAAWAKQFKVAF